MEILFHEKPQKVDTESTDLMGSLSGRIYDTFLNKIEGAEITLTDDSRGFNDYFITDISGEFLFSSLPEGDELYSITIARTGYETKVANNISVIPDENNDMGTIYILSSSAFPGTIKAILFNAISGEPIEGAEIVVTKYDNSTADTKISNSSGNFITANLEQGKYVVTMSKTGYIDIVIDVELDGDIDLGDIGLYPVEVNNGSLSGKIFDSFQNVVQGATVSIANSTGFISDTTTTGPDGKFSFSFLPEGMNIYTITVEKAGFNTSIKNNVSVVANTDTDVGIIYLVSTSAVPGKITGRVIDANDGSNVAGANVEIISYDNTVADTTISDVSGNFVTAILNPGSYTIVVSKTNYYNFVIDNRIVNGDTDIYNLAICSLLTGNQIRVYVLWADRPLDLDLHVVGPTSNADTESPLWDGSPVERFHTYYMLNYYNELTGLYNSGLIDNGTSALVQDANTGVGPETVNFGGAYDYGTYTFTIFNFSKTDWHGGKYMPVLRIYDAMGLVQEIPFPSTAPGPDEWFWKVFKMDINGPAREDRTISIPNSGHYLNYNGMEYMEKTLMDW